MNLIEKVHKQVILMKKNILLRKTAVVTMIMYKKVYLLFTNNKREKNKKNKQKISFFLITIKMRIISLKNREIKIEIITKNLED